jgi:hypothetical protein
VGENLEPGRFAKNTNKFFRKTIQSQQDTRIMTAQFVPETANQATAKFHRYALF